MATEINFFVFDPGMGRNLLLLWTLAISLVTLVTGDDNTPKPCRMQLVGKQLRCVVPDGYSVRSGDCPGNDISALYRDRTTLKKCAQLCSSLSECHAFMFYNNHITVVTQRPKPVVQPARPTPSMCFTTKFPPATPCDQETVLGTINGISPEVARPVKSALDFAIPVQLVTSLCTTTTIGAT